MPGQPRAGLRIDAQENRRRILVAAGEAFAADGIDVPIRRIARRAGVGVATVYRHFPTKDDLLTEAFAAQTESCAQIVAEGLATADPWQGFAHVVEKVMLIHARDRGFARVATARMSARSAAERDESVRGMLELLRRARAAGVLRGDVGLDDVALVLMANEGIRADSSERRLAAAQRLAALVLRSFRADPAGAAPAADAPVREVSPR